ncbi:hypothetical protein CMI38_07065 [Candidatus Pacearchaeota archaeon]|jgi:hypothetical protein|nr:hypothetical protein [Candidatus Pacearchaeota archaeon]|tara:strand:- start:6778 stop:7560 length:783 start_codon:yes stop_codon:yes gene_type:complete
MKPRFQFEAQPIPTNTSDKMPKLEDFDYNSLLSPQFESFLGVILPHARNDPRRKHREKQRLRRVINQSRSPKTSSKINYQSLLTSELIYHANKFNPHSPKYFDEFHRRLSSIGINKGDIYQIYPVEQQTINESCDYNLDREIRWIDRDLIEIRPYQKLYQKPYQVEVPHHDSLTLSELLAITEEADHLKNHHLYPKNPHLDNTLTEISSIPGCKATLLNKFYERSGKILTETQIARFTENEFALINKYRRDIVTHIEPWA